jgi:preprotein translocase subunit YajC
MGCGQSSTPAAKPEVVKQEEAQPNTEPAKPAKGEATEGLKVGDKVSVSKDGGFEGEVLARTTTDVLVKGPDGEEVWCGVEDVRSRLKPGGAPCQPLTTELQVGRVVHTARGVTGTVAKHTTTDVCLKTEAGEEVWVDVEDITYLSVSIQGAVGLRDADIISKSDPYCVCQLEGKPDSKVETQTVNDNLEPLWNFEARMVSYVQGDALTFEIYDKDMGILKDDFLGRAKLTSEQIGAYGFFGDLQLEDKSGNLTKATLRVQVRLVNAEISQPEAEPQTQEPLAQEAAVEVVEVTPAAQRKCCW